MLTQNDFQNLGRMLRIEADALREAGSPAPMTEAIDRYRTFMPHISADTMRDAYNNGDDQ